MPFPLHILGTFLKDEANFLTMVDRKIFQCLNIIVATGLLDMS